MLKPDWDVEKGLRLYRGNSSYAVIAKACNTTPDTVRYYANLNWPERKTLHNSTGNRVDNKRTSQPLLRTVQQMAGRAGAHASTGRTLAPLSIESMPILRFPTDD